MHGVILRFGDEWWRGKMIQLILLQYSIYWRSGRQVVFWEIENVDGITCFSLTEYCRHTIIQKWVYFLEISNCVNEQLKLLNWISLGSRSRNIIPVYLNNYFTHACNIA